MAAIHRDFGYAPNTTRVDSPIERGARPPGRACARTSRTSCSRCCAGSGLPCRYVSGYIAPRALGEDDGTDDHCHPRVGRGAVARARAGSASIPTNNIEAGLRHVRVAVGRDYADVPPTRGIYKGGSTSTLEVSVEVTPGETLPTLDTSVQEKVWSAEAIALAEEQDFERRRQEQQQQQ